MTTDNKHPHYDLIVKWAANTSQKVWLKNNNEWLAIGYPAWDMENQYHIGPTPPPKMCRLGGLEFPLPETVAPECNTGVWIANAGGYAVGVNWNGSNYHVQKLQAGLLHLSMTAGNQHSAALAAANTQAIKDAV